MVIVFGLLCIAAPFLLALWFAWSGSIDGRRDWWSDR